MKKHLFGISCVISILLVSQPSIEAQSASGIWISPAELALLPTSSPAWDSVFSQANSICATPNLADQDDSANVCILAKALVFARIGGGGYRSDVVAALRSIVDLGAYNGRALALGREIGAYVISADLISLPTYDPTLDQQFRAKIRELLTIFTSDGPASLIECHETRPNNWGTHCGGARAAVAAYLGDTAELARVAQVFKGWLGDRSSYSGFVYGDLSWQCDPSQPVGINPAGCMKDGHSIDGVLADDQRRGGSFAWPPPKVNYVYESLQGTLLQATILHRAGYDAFNWVDKALVRAYGWLHEQANFPTAGDDTWQPHVANYFYGVSFPAPVPSSPGKNLGWTDWVFGLESAPPSPEPTPDTTAPIISSVSASRIKAVTATIQWLTDEPSTTQVEYGTTTALGQSTAAVQTLALSHSQNLNKLQKNTTYYYRVRSADAAGNAAVSSIFAFTTAK